MAEKIWFVTGASKGFGRIWSEAALKRGDKVAATARRIDDVAGLADAYGDAVLPLALDVTDRAAVFAAIGQAHERFGRLDVVVNNAGYGLFGTIEEVSEADARAQIETNLFGALWVLQAALPIMREQRGGHLISTSSIGGVTAFPNVGLYHASKWGLEAINQSLAQEVAAFGIKVTLIEPAGYTTDWSGPSAKRSDEMAAYDPIRQQRTESAKSRTKGDPYATADAVLQIVDAEQPPLRFLLGSDGLPIIRKDYDSRLAVWDGWNAVSSAAQ
ncbi:SDR family oxidoreductase [Sphingomonas bacterium]|uniref:SDR family oxidoreductase n=1 Tax=Sphingomonas bacterium TaxID=1895847 RepID=UPI0015776E01|nr:SDR family oxidoreductase [Sphingomonas bacterium]